ncbi:MAG: cytochrome c [Bacteroidota bacterium]
MKKLWIFLFLAALVYACGGTEDASSSSSGEKPKVVADAQPEIDAKKIWKVRCIACHGLYGNQGLNGAANLEEVDIPIEERIAIITNGKQGEKGVMTAFGEILSPEEIEAVAKYTMTFNKNL